MQRLHPSLVADTESLRNSVRVERVETGTGFTLTAARGRCELTVHTPGVIEGRYVGHAVDEFVGPVAVLLDTWVRSAKRITLAVDASELSSYTTGFRSAWTDWMWRNRALLRSVPILFRSPIVEMGINLAARAVGGAITAHTNAGEYRRAVDRAVEDALAGR